MNGTENRDRSGSHYSNKGDENIDAGLARVRMALLSLPQEKCRPGFEYRLSQRIREEEFDVQPRAARTWASGWLGVGLGFACAAVIALFALDFDGIQTTTAPVAGVDEQVAPVEPTTDPATDPAMHADAAASDGSSADTWAETDSVPQKSPVSISGERLRQAGNNVNDAEATK